MQCIFCDLDSISRSIEHIVPESFGNKLYVIEKGRVCDNCNARFSGNEGKALSNTVFVVERARFGIETKKGKSAKGKIGEIEIKGSDNFEEGLLTVKGLSKENFKNYDPETKIGQLHVKSFDKSETATSKMLLKIGLESIFTSQRKLFKRYDFTELKDYLQTRTNDDWPFIVTDIECVKFISIPRFMDKYRLKNINCELLYAEIENGLLFKFKYGAIAMVINLVTRSLNWMPPYLRDKKLSKLVPDHFNKKLLVSK